MGKITAEVERRTLKLRAPLRTSKATITTREIFILQLRDEHGAWGRGEVAPVYWLDGEDLRKTQDSLKALADFIRRNPEEQMLRALVETAERGDGGANLEAQADESGKRVWDGLSGGAMYGPPALSPAVRCALDEALLELEANRRGVSVADVLCDSETKLGGERRILEISAILSSSDESTVFSEVFELIGIGYRRFKLKLDGSDEKSALAMLRALARAVDKAGVDGVWVRLDANQGFDFARACAFLKLACAEVPIEFIEEPLKTPTVELLRRLRVETNVPVALDESMLDASRLEPYARARAADVVVIKASRVGGLRIAYRIAKAACRLGFKVCVTDAIEGAVGMAAAVHLGASLLPDVLALGLGGARYLSDDSLPGFPTNSPTLCASAPGLCVSKG